jgi:hypothetical protein
MGARFIFPRDVRGWCEHIGADLRRYRPDFYLCIVPDAAFSGNGRDWRHAMESVTLSNSLLRCAGFDNVVPSFDTSAALNKPHVWLVSDKVESNLLIQFLQNSKPTSITCVATRTAVRLNAWMHAAGERCARVPQEQVENKSVPVMIWHPERFGGTPSALRGMDVTLYEKAPVWLCVAMLMYVSSQLHAHLPDHLFALTRQLANSLAFRPLKHHATAPVIEHRNAPSVGSNSTHTRSKSVATRVSPDTRAEQRNEHDVHERVKRHRSRARSPTPSPTCRPRSPSPERNYKRARSVSKFRHDVFDDDFNKKEHSKYTKKEHTTTTQTVQYLSAKWKIIDRLFTLKTLLSKTGLQQRQNLVSTVSRRS